ncbi:MAG: hypothetical protein H6Q67_1282 [Firmicutes bacterium]|nr:hypothetical protein [Bacillota bacterium]
MNNVQPLDFDKLSNEKIRILENVKEMVLSTSAKDRVTSRVVSCSCHGTKIYFLSWSHHTKCLQILENPYVAFCHETLQMEGIASIKGNPLDPENSIYADKYKCKQAKLFDTFTKFDGMVLIEVDIKLITSFPVTEKEYFLDRIDFDQKIAYRTHMRKA